MALTDFFIDSSIGGTSGTGTKADPYSSLGFAFSQNPVMPTGQYLRFNVKGTLAGSPETDLGTLPTGTGASTYIGIWPYITDAGDDPTGYVYLDAGSSQAGWDAQADFIQFIRCFFTGGAGTFGDQNFCKLDNNINMFGCHFFGTKLTFDQNCVARHCTFTNMTNKVFDAAQLSEFEGNYIQVNGGTSSGGIVIAPSVRNNIFDIRAGQHAYGIGAESNTTSIEHNTVYMAPAVTGSRRGIKLDDITSASGNYIEGATNAFYIQSSCKTYWAQNNYYHNCTNGLGGGSSELASTVNLTEPYGVTDPRQLSSSIYNDVAGGDWTLSTSGVDRTGQLPENAVIGSTIDITTNTTTGAVLEYPTGGGGGGTTGRQGLHGIESGSV